jgi:hypothetical protein
MGCPERFKNVPREQWSARTDKDVMQPAQDSVIVRPDEKMIRVLEKMQESGTQRVWLLVIII